MTKKNQRGMMRTGNPADAGRDAGEGFTLFSEPVLSALMVSTDGQQLAMDGQMRRVLRERLAAGELDELVFRAVVFRAEYPNANYLRFHDADLAGFAASFAGQPFLRDHDARRIESRGGTIRESFLWGNEFMQEIVLTVPRDIEAFLNGQIDRFSISWYWQKIVCSVCGHDWLGVKCPHWPGQTYDGKVCELIFEGPRGKETSAVNAPAVQGTGVLAELVALKRQDLAREPVHTKKDEVMMSDDVEMVMEPAPPAEIRVVAPSTSSPSTGSGVTAVVAAAGAPPVVVDVLVGGDTAASTGSAAGASTAGATGGAGEGAVADAWVAYLERQALQAALAGSGLPAAFQEVVRAECEGKRVTPAGLDAAIARQRALWARLQEDQTIQNVRPVASSMSDGLDRVSEALTALVEGRPTQRGVRPLTGIREAYMLLSGDYEMTGMFRPENVGLANVNSSTMAGIVANALNKVVVNQFQAYPRWWEPIVVVQNFNRLQPVRWITLGGVPALPEVYEGAAYTELTWDDQTETAAWRKKGGYLGITLETIDKDDVEKVRQAPKALAAAAWLTLSRAISDIFTLNSGVGPTMSDGLALFHASHSNLGTSALSPAAWTAVRTAMRKQTEVNSGERLGGLVVPRFLLVPPDLEGTALQVLGSENDYSYALANGPAAPANVWAEGDGLAARLANARRRVIVVDLWTDTNNWAAVADPMLYPSIGLGFRFGEVPEIFSVSSPNSGLMFSNDVLPVKVRWFFAVGATDWRGMYKANVP